VFLLVAFRGQPGDDPYVTYRYASNLASGRGFVFNLGEQVQSSTAPLFTLVLALLGFLGSDIPTMGYVLSALGLLAFALFAVRLAALAEPPMPWLGLAAAALTFVCPVTTFGLGSEMPMLIALSWGCWLAATRQHWHLAALLAALAAVTRGDGVLVGVAVALVFLWTNRGTDARRWPWSAALVYAAVLAPWYLFAWLYFGSPLPATLGTKLIEGNAPGTVTFFEGLGIFWVRSFGGQPAVWLPALVLAAIGYVAMFRRGRATALPAVWAALYVAGYSLMHVPRYPWYYSPLAPVAVFALLLGGNVVGTFAIEQLSKVRPVRRPAFAGMSGTLAIAAIFCAVFVLEDVRTKRPEPSARTQMYATIGDWLRTNTSESASVGAEEVGLIGYSSQRRMVDFVGLLQPEVAPHRVKGDSLWAPQRFRPDYIVALPAWLGSVGASSWVQSNYVAVHTFEGPKGEKATLLATRSNEQGANNK
jgi:hypothetical protein